ncbi:hypothetical protein CCH79_00000051 [Gambusia affinis]|uniref:Protein phosphatase 1 regulatory subunit 14C n=1 Tax=Gambusia affinis TaxID=33528 RepID=A0A315VZM7_GAMAF|nr:hypothetical protein CCH79_00000051 [Gambusia affinis]
MSAASTETSAPLPTAGSRVFFQGAPGVGCVSSGPINGEDPVQKKQGKVTVKYDRKELRKRLVLEEWIIEELSKLYDCEILRLSDIHVCLLQLREFYLLYLSLSLSKGCMGRGGKAAAAAAAAAAEKPHGCPFTHRSPPSKEAYSCEKGILFLFNTKAPVCLPVTQLRTSPVHTEGHCSKLFTEEHKSKTKPCGPYSIGFVLRAKVCIGFSCRLICFREELSGFREDEMPEVEIDIDDLLEVNSDDERASKLQESLTDCFKPTENFVSELLCRIRGMRKLSAPTKKGL